MQFTSLFTLVLAAVFATATPTTYNVLEARSGDGNTTLVSRSGCNSVGPLGDGHYKWWIVAPCTPGAPSTCQATDATGCLLGNADKIGSLEVDDPNDEQQFASQKYTNTVQFTCPQGGQVRCEANFDDNNDGPNYSLRVF